ncbi:hypothetical protein BS47DRAFT_901369 [Hydnum rufescens UP504]|uniref:CID domain-containing protein n=1 Tax=Hydnum rufescens UP504 TaxID=1448309 RepID=A0A9P6AYQ7_9AGAM|nr:hypothetical protein BS47DRAFT_901369 [Hydnum rufescens UP504]
MCFFIKVHPAIKLPPFYLLDSVSKNLGAPYTVLFSSFITALFLDSYNAVDESTRSKMEEMLVTWRTGGPGGVELFGANAQLNIEGAVWGNVASGSSGPTQSQVLIELDVILAQKTRALEQNPADSEARNHIEVLQQLRTMVQLSAMSKADLSAIVTRLRDLARTTASTAPALPGIPPPPPVSYSSQPTSYPISPPPPPSYPTGPLSSILTSLINTSPSSTPTPPPLQAPSAPDVSQLFRNLVAAGIVTDPAAQNETPPAPSKIEPINETKPVDPKLEAMREYERTILSFPVSLSSTGLQRPQPNIISMMYERLPLKCKQCATRFSDDEVGSKARDDHLDLHFRQNRRASQTVGRGHCRSWFVGTDDWVHDVADVLAAADVKGKDRIEGAPTSAKAAAAAAAERDAKLRAMFVVVPPGDESKPITCPVCRDQLKSEFLEDDEEWVWKNAISVRGKVYHATCHAEAMSAMVAARLRDQTSPLGKRSPRSRSGTPDAVSTPDASLLKSPPPSTGQPRPASLLGSKRKLRDQEEDPPAQAGRPGVPTGGVDVRSDPVGTEPPVKRMRSASPRAS